ncbi:MAG: hypothetical protein ABL886_06805 [Rhodoglobus sp.]
MNETNGASDPVELDLEMIEWLDASGIDGWADLDEAYGLETYRCWSVGVTIHETDDFVKLAGSLASEDGEPKLVGGLMCIPKGMIRSRRKLVVEPDEGRGNSRVSKDPEGPTPPLWKGSSCNASVGVN